MEISPSKKKLLGKRKKDQEVQEKKIKVDDGESSSQESNEESSSQESNEESSSQEINEESSSQESNEESDTEDSIRGNITELNLSEEAFIKKLFHDTMVMIRSKIDVEDEEIKEAYNEIKEKFKVFQFTKIDFNASENLIAYFYAYSTFNTILARDRFLDAFRNCPQLQDHLKKQSLKIISLGGGPGTDMIGFCSALQDYLKQHEVENKRSSVKKLDITVVDVWKRWASFNNAIEFLIREGNYGNVSTIYTNKIISSSFIVTDLLSQKPSNKYTLELKIADIVLLVRVLDSFNFYETRPDDLIYNITSGMKSGALLLVIDSVTKNFANSKVKEIYKSKLSAFKRNIDLKLICPYVTCKESSCDILIIQKK